MSPEGTRQDERYLVFRTAADVQQVIAADHFRIGIGQERKREASALLKAFRNIRRVYADRYRLDALCRKFIDVLLNASQLEVAKGSPVAAIED